VKLQILLLLILKKKEIEFYEHTPIIYQPHPNGFEEQYETWMDDDINDFLDETIQKDENIDIDYLESNSSKFEKLSIYCTMYIFSFLNMFDIISSYICQFFRQCTFYDHSKWDYYCDEGIDEDDGEAFEDAFIQEYFSLVPIETEIYEDLMDAKDWLQTIDMNKIWFSYWIDVIDGGNVLYLDTPSVFFEYFPWNAMFIEWKNDLMFMYRDYCSYEEYNNVALLENEVKEILVKDDINYLIEFNRYVKYNILSIKNIKIYLKDFCFESEVIKIILLNKNNISLKKN